MILLQKIGILMTRANAFKYLVAMIVIIVTKNGCYTDELSASNLINLNISLVQPIKNTNN